LGLHLKKIELGKEKFVEGILISLFVLICNISVILFFRGVFHIFLVVFAIKIKSNFFIFVKTRILFFYFHCVDLKYISRLFFMRFEILIILFTDFKSLFFKLFIFFAEWKAKWPQIGNICKFLRNSTISAILRMSIMIWYLWSVAFSLRI